MSSFRLDLGSPLGQVEEVDAPEQIWGQFKSSVLSAQKSLPAASSRQEVDWVTDDLRALSQQKKVLAEVEDLPK